MSKFKVGDKVKIIGNRCCHKFNVGEIAIIDKARDSQGAYAVAYLDKRDFWYVLEEDMELVEEKTISGFKVGDRVKLNPEISDFRHGRGGVSYDEIGEIHLVRYDGAYLVEFPSYGRDWTGVEGELILVDKVFEYVKNDVMTLKAVTIKIDKMEEEKDMNKILNLYMNRKIEKINKKYDEIIEKEYNENEFVKQYNTIVENFKENIKMLYENPENLVDRIIVDTGVSGDNFKYVIVRDLKEQIANKYDKEKMEEIQKIENLVKEIETTLSLAESGNGEINQDRVIEILSNYQIIDKKTLKIKE